MFIKKIKNNINLILIVFLFLLLIYPNLSKATEFSSLLDNKIRANRALDIYNSLKVWNNGSSISASHSVTLINGYVKTVFKATQDGVSLGQKTSTTGGVTFAKSKSPGKHTITVTAKAFRKSGKSTVSLQLKSKSYTYTVASSSGGTTKPTTPPEDTPYNPTPIIPADTTSPTTNITADVGQNTETNSSQINYTITFSETVTGFEQQDVTINKGKITNFSGQGTTYNLTVETDTDTNYTQTVQINANVCQDAAGNGNTASNSYSINIDRIKPEVKILGNSEKEAVTEYIKQIYQNTLSRQPQESDIQSHLMVYVGAKDLTKLSKDIIASQEAKQKITNNTDYAKAMYKSILNREPDSTGLENWKQKIDEQGIEKTIEEFCTSQEVQNVFKQIKEKAKTNIILNKNDELTIVFGATDEKYNSSNITANDIMVKTGETVITPSKKELTKTQKIDKGEAYILTLGGITGNGELSITIPTAKFQDVAGNVNDEKSSSEQEETKLNVIVDNTKPEVKKASLTGANGNGYVKNGDTIKLNLEFSEPIASGLKVKIAGRDATVQGSGTTYTASLQIPLKEISLNEGEISIEISGYTDESGLVGDTITKTTDSSKIIYDRTAPTINSISPNGNTTWQKVQKTVVSASDNLTSNDKIIGKYVFVPEGESVADIENIFQNNSEIVKQDGTGKYILYIQVEDLAGNTRLAVTNPFYLDNQVTEAGKIKITKDSKTGEELVPTEKTDTEGNKYYEITYTNKNLYITKIDGKDDESGHKSTIYEVNKILADGTKISVGTPSIEDTIIETAGDYEIIVTTKDNLDNSAKRKYKIHIDRSGPQITITPNGNSGYEKTKVVTVNAQDISDVNTQISYSIVKEGEEPTYNKTVVNGGTININGLTGKYYIYVKAQDKSGNETIVKSNPFYFDNSVTTIGSLEMKENDKDGKEYVDNTFTKENVYLKIKDHGKDEETGSATSTYKIVKQNEQGNDTVIGEYTNESTVLQEEGIYKITLTTKDSSGNQGSKTYTVKIDKTAPTIKFEGLEDYVTIGAITVKITDEKISASGVNRESLKYYWTRSTKEPSKEDFEGTDDKGFRGKLNGEQSLVKVPDNISGIWYLWILAEDNVGNISIKSNVKIEDDGNVSYVDNEAPVAGTLEMKLENNEGEEYIQDTFTNKNVWINLQNGYDADSGVKQNTYIIKKDGNTIKQDQTGENTLTETGIYDIIITTIDNQENSSTREYKIKIDKNGPQIAFNPNGNEAFYKKNEIQVQVTEPETESGVNEASIVIKWIGYNPKTYKSIDEVISKIEEIQENVQEEKLKEELAKIEIYYEDAKQENGKIQTPENATGIYHLYVYAEDNVENKTIKISESFSLDNKEPTKPDAYATIKVQKGTKEEEVNYYEETTNKTVYVYAKNSESLSKVDKYEYSITTDGGQTWSDWEDCTAKEEDEIYGKIEVLNHGRQIVKFRGISILEDGENIGIGSEEIVINQDIEGPKVEFANTDDGESGNQEYQIKAEVRVTVIDESGIDENSLKYTWVKFNTKEEYEEFINGNKTIEELKEKMMENSKSFANGEPIVIKNSEKGVYSLFIYSKDTLGNETVNISNPYYIYKDNQGPNITFNNTQDGGNGNSKWETTAKVNVNVTDESGVDENSLKYEWVIFNSKEEYETFIKENTEIEKLKNKMQNQTMFLNGQELIISSEERKIYSLFVYAKDTVGNENISISNPYYIGNSKQDEASYEVKENYIINVIPETKVEEFIEKVKNTIIGENYNLYDNNKEQIKYDSKENQNNNSDKTKDNQNENLNSKTNFVATGDILKVDEKEYTVIVLGDLNSDGLLNVIDLAKLKKYITEIENLDEKYKLSADINQDETVNIIDSVRAKQYITGLRIFEEN